MLLLFPNVSLCSISSIENPKIPIVIRITEIHLVIEYEIDVKIEVKIITDIGLQDLLKTLAGYETYSEILLLVKYLNILNYPLKCS